MPGQHVIPRWDDFPTDALLEQREVFVSHLSRRPTHKPSRAQLLSVERVLAEREEK